MSAEETVLILQIGSLGDTVVSLPCYREIERRHPHADRYLLTNYPIGSKMVPAEEILLATGVIKGSLPYPMPLRQISKMIELRRSIAALKPSILYYLLPEVRTTNLVRHFLFFKLCGIRRFCGIPWSPYLRVPREISPGRLWESEASRLLRAIGVDAVPPSDADRDLNLSTAEYAKVDAALEALGPVNDVIAVSVGGKVPINDWGDDNWSRTLAELSRRSPLTGAVFVGSADEKPRNTALASAWAGPSLNTCGEFSARETAALIARAKVFLGHDTGTMHLAAAVNTPVVAVFSARNRAGKWFSDRNRDTFFYNHVACAGCEIVAVKDCPEGLLCMAGHSTSAVAHAACRMIQNEIRR